MNLGVGRRYPNTVDVVGVVNHDVVAWVGELVRVLISADRDTGAALLSEHRIHLRGKPILRHRAWKGERSFEGEDHSRVSGSDQYRPDLLGNSPGSYLNGH